MRSITCFILSLVFFSSQAQHEPTWSRSFESSVEWQRITSLGLLIAHSDGSLMGINTDNGEKIWQVYEVGKLSESSFAELGKSNFFTITSSTDGNQVILVNSLNGKILIDTKEKGISNILGSDVLQRLGIILMVVEKAGASQASLIAFDINTGEELWSNDELFKVDLGGLSFGKSKLGGLLNQAAQNTANQANKSGLLAKPLAIDDNSLLLLHPNFSYCIDPSTGEEKWNIPNEGGAVRASAALTPIQSGTVFIGVEKEQQSSGFSSSSSADTGPTYNYELYAVDIASGNQNWSKPYLQRNANLSNLIFADNGVIVSPPSTNGKVSVNLIDYASGLGQWGKKGKGNKVKGSVISSRKFEGGWLVTLAYDNAWNNAGEEYYVNVLNPDGMMRFDKNVKLKGNLRSTELLDKGLLYITDKEVNILNLATGEQLFDSPVAASPLNASNYDPLKHSLAYSDRGDRLYVFSSRTDQVYLIDKVAGSIKPVGAKVKFEGKETPYMMEVHDNGVVLNAEQNIMKIGNDGSVMYQNYYPAPRQAGILRALAAAQAVRAAYIGAASAAYSAAFAQAAAESNDELGQQVGNELSQGFGELSDAGFAYSRDAMAYAKKRFTASAKTPAYMFILTDLGKRQYSLVQVDKKTGAKAGSIDLGRDREPSYEIDDIYSRVFYLSEPTKIVCYQF